MEIQLLGKILLSALLIPIIGFLIWPIVWGIYGEIKNLPPVKEPNSIPNRYLYTISIILIFVLISEIETKTKTAIVACTWSILSLYFCYRGTTLKGGIKSKGLSAQKSECMGNTFYGAYHTKHHIGLYIILFLMIYMIFMPIYS